MRAGTRKLWEKQDQHEGDRWRLFQAIAEAVDADRVLYAGSYVDVAPSFVWPSVTYVDVDRRAARFFDDTEGVHEIIAAHPPPPERVVYDFIAGDYTDSLPFEPESFDLLISLYGGFVSEHCTRYLRVGGSLLVNPSHGDAALASLDHRYALSGVVQSRSGAYSVSVADLDTYLAPEKPDQVTRELVHRTGRGVAYTRSAFAYLFLRVR